MNSGLTRARGLWAGVLIAACVAAPASLEPAALTDTPAPATTAAAPLPTGSPTPGPTATERLIPTIDPAVTPAAILPCLLFSSGEASAVLGEPAADPIATPGGCVYLDSASGQHVLSLFMLPPQNSAEAIRGHALLLGAFGVPVNTEMADALAALGPQRDMVGVIEGLAQLAAARPDLTVARLDGVGDDAIWIVKSHTAVRQGFLMIARAGSLIGLDIVVTIGRDEASLRAGVLYAAGQVLSRLPEHFSLLQPTPTVTPTRPTPTPQLTVSPAAALTGSPTLAATPTLTPRPSSPTPGPTLKPPAFSEPIVSNSLVGYGGLCAPNLVTISVKVVDPSGLSGIANVSIVARLVGQGRASDWKATPMRAEGGEVWLQTLVVERDFVDYQTFADAQVEFYFLAVNNAGVSAESPHHGLQSNPLTLRACPTPTPTP